MDIVNTVCIVFLPIYTGKCINWAGEDGKNWSCYFHNTQINGELLMWNVYEGLFFVTDSFPIRWIAQNQAVFVWCAKFNKICLNKIWADNFCIAAD